MNRIDRAIDGINSLALVHKRDCFLCTISPFVKLALTFLYLVTTVSFKSMQLSSLVFMAVYPVFMFISCGLSLKAAVKNLSIVFPVILVMALLNPFFDRVPVYEIFICSKKIIITDGMISSASLVMKGLLTVFASYILISTTTMDEICACFAKVELPSVMVVQLMLAFRYITVFLGEVKKTSQAYSLRAPGQKGIGFRAWGSLTGGMILRSFDRAQEIYEAMSLRGFSMEWFHAVESHFGFRDFLFLVLWSGIIVAVRIFPVYEVMGQLVEKISGVF